MAPSRPKWLLPPQPRKLRLRFGRNVCGNDLVVRFKSSSYLVEPDGSPLARGVKCVPNDSNKTTGSDEQSYTLHFSRAAVPLVAFDVSAKRDDNSTDFLQVNFEGDVSYQSFRLRINTYSTKSFDIKTAFLLKDLLRELPIGWRALAVTAIAALLVLVPPWYWFDLQTLPVRAGWRSDLTQVDLRDGFNLGKEEWELSSEACGGFRSPDATSPPDSGAYQLLWLRSPCFAIASLKSSLGGYHPLSCRPALGNFRMKFPVDFKESDRLIVLLHAKPVMPLLRLIVGRVSGDCLVIERGRPSSQELRLTGDCAPKRPGAQNFKVLHSSQAFASVAVEVHSLNRFYFVWAEPTEPPGRFDNCTLDTSKRACFSFPASAKRGSVGFLAAGAGEHRVLDADIYHEAR